MLNSNEHIYIYMLKKERLSHSTTRMIILIRYSFGWAQGHQWGGRGHKSQVRKQIWHTTKSKKKENQSVKRS